MIVSDLLSELREGILHDVSDQVAGASDSLWSDATLIRYIDQAQKRFARRTLCIRDKTTAKCCQFTTVLNQDEYPLDPSVLAVLSVRMAGDNADLARAGHPQFDTYHVPDTYFFDPTQLSNLPPGKPLAFATDEYVTADTNGSMGVANLRLYPVVGTGYSGVVGTMRVARLPLNSLTAATLSASPEIPDAYHLDMLDWAAYLALRIVDLDQGAADRAKEFAQSFEAHVQEAIKEFKRKTFTPMQWGFGRNGFSWDKL